MRRVASVEWRGRGSGLWDSSGSSSSADLNPSPFSSPFGQGGPGKREGVFIPSTGSLFIPGWDPQAGTGLPVPATVELSPVCDRRLTLPLAVLVVVEMEGLGTYFCSGVKNRADDERPLVTLKLAVDR